ncbi:MAG: ABC transporter ATP-binding protein [Devosia sp.]
MAILTANGLRKRFGADTALDGLDLSLNDGEVLALLGPTGAGKTTTLRAISGLETLDEGTIHLDGRDITKDSARARDFAVVFEGFNLLPPLSVFDNIAFPLRSPVYKETEEEVRTRVTAAATDLKIGHLLERRIDQLSGGERQRVAIARALVRRPRVFLLDEPLSALDLKLREALQAELSLMHAKYGATVLYATHDFPSASELGDRIALIDGGRILQVGTLDTLIEDPHYAAVGRLVGSPSMALFEGHLDNSAVTLSDGSLSVDAAALSLGGAAPGPVTLGIWPEDIDLRLEASDATTDGTVWATDFRGRDRALEVHFGNNRFRKVVPLTINPHQGETVHFTVDPHKAFVFSGATGARLDTRTREAA